MLSALTSIKIGYLFPFGQFALSQFFHKVYKGTMSGSIEILRDIVGLSGSGETRHPFKGRAGVNKGKFSINLKKKNDRSFAAVTEEILRSLIEKGEFNESGTIRMVAEDAQYTGGASALRPKIYKGKKLPL